MELIRPLATKSADPAFRNVHTLGFGSYVSAVRQALVTAEDNVVIITPFIDGAGTKLLAESWEARVTDEVSWEIYVRKVSPSLRAVIKDKPWRVFEYSGGESFGMHAKVISADNRTAILGSMNLLRMNMYSNLELGLEIKNGPVVRKISKLEYWLQKASTELKF